MPVNVVGTSGFPLSGLNRVRSQAIKEIADHSGGSNRPDVQQTAGDAWDAAVRDFNEVLWKFNRVTQDITIAINTSDYTLNTDFRAHLRAMVLNSSNKTVDELIWVDYKDWLDRRPDQSSTGTQPVWYTAINQHETGLVTFDPPCGATLPTNPKIRIIYFRRIAIQSNPQLYLDVPMEVDEAIFQMGVAFHIRKILGPGHPDSATMMTLAKQKKAFVMEEYRDYPDSTAVWR